MTITKTPTVVAGGVGTSPIRPDGIPKVRGEFAYSSDLEVDGMLWGSTVRSPHARARIVSIDVAPALAIRGVAAALTIADVGGRGLFGLIEPDQPVLADGEVRFWGEPVAVVAADDRETARIAATAVVVHYEPLDPLTDPERAEELGETFRVLDITRGDPDARGEVVVEGYYEVGMQDQAQLGTESGLAIPDGSGGVDLHVSTQWLHVDHEQVVASLGLPPEQLRLHLAGIGGAFGAREDISLQIHLCLLALRTGRPVKMVYDRAESFVGHVHRHPARMWFRHEADRDGILRRVEARILLDGGAFASTSPAVLANAAYFAVGPYASESVTVHAAAARTNNPPCGAMRGFGAVQSCFGYEAQMDRLAAALGIDPVELRLRNALDREDRIATTGQVIVGSLPTRRVIEALRALPLPDEAPGDDPRRLPGGTGLTTSRAAVMRGVGFAVGIKNLAFSEAFDDFTEVRAELTADGIRIHTAAAEVGQGLVTVIQQIARTATGISNVEVVWDHTGEIGSAGSTSASRQTQMTGGATLRACEAVAAVALARADAESLDDEGAWRDDQLVMTLADLVAAGPIEHLERFRHPPTTPPDEHGNGDVHAGYAVAAHRAIVDVDPELGLVHVVRVDTAQDVGRVLNPQAVIGQIEGGIMQGVGLAIMEEIVIDRGVMKNASFTDYLLPTFLDAPDMTAVLIEEPDHWGPFGAKGVGEPPTISSTAAVVAAIRNATGRDLNRAPVRPEDIVGL
ncbi:MAG: xanthine dehydrogenase subunit D [Actinobacteria bacterium RBG_16_68_21]|nr:MAG: xanthine dehydrogenase subunit D [Actinobacteria bacterium RBG_16_68_21]